MRRALWIAGFIVSVAAFWLALFQLAETGTCASGGPYVIANECPSGLGWWVALLIVSIFACVGTGFGLPAGTDSEKGRGRGWLPIFMFFPGTRESAIFGPLTGAVILAAGTDTTNVVMACVLIFGAPLTWLGVKWLMADTDRVLAERRRKAAGRR